MIRPSTILLLTAAMALSSVPGRAQTASPAPHHHAHKTVKPARSVAPTAAVGGINTPSTDFSTVERADDDDTGSGRTDRGSMKPVMGASGNIGLGTGF